MKISYLIDTDWVVSNLNGVERVRTKLLELEPYGLGISIISLAELYEGVYYSRDPEVSMERLRDFLKGIAVLEIDDGICRVFGQQRGLLRRRGLLIGDLDVMIAATCIYHQIPLCTNNIEHFKRIDGLEIISI
ncbi:TPA: type II toxin-antitoxin system VapC family toxin [Candidatus Poribacteria bacterium]|nr:type II toxin-antitoxin system VapC family toxin [Candidatus Poribacteria bacterium]